MDLYDAFVNADFLSPDPSSGQVPSAVDSSGNSLSTLPWGKILKFGGSAVGAFGQLMMGEEMSDAYQYNAQLALEQGKLREEDIDTAEEATLGTQHAMYAKAGVTMSGSPLDVALNTATGFEMDKQIVRYNTESRANMDNYQAKVAQSQSKIKAGESLLSGGAQLALSLL